MTQSVSGCKGPFWRMCSQHDPIENRSINPRGTVSVTGVFLRPTVLTFHFGPGKTIYAMAPDEEYDSEVCLANIWLRKCQGRQ
jgi:hypothetical protein